jgi:hypothetical protein
MRWPGVLIFLCIVALAWSLQGQQRPLPNSHRASVLRTFPILRKAESMPGCGMGESYFFRFKTRVHYEEFKKQLTRLRWKGERGMLNGRPASISHEWHRDKHRRHVTINLTPG